MRSGAGGGATPGPQILARLLAPKETLAAETARCRATAHTVRKATLQRNFLLRLLPLTSHRTTPEPLETGVPAASAATHKESKGSTFLTVEGARLETPPIPSGSPCRICGTCVSNIHRGGFLGTEREIS